MSLSFYVHIPYCIKRCGYCDFNTYTPSELQDGATLEVVSGDYIDAVLKELEFAPIEQVPTIFFGGGTPSLIPPHDLGRVITAIKNRNGLTDDCEITLEANPDSVTAEKLEGYFAAGFNRISFGMQSTSTHVLKVLDRRAMMAVSQAPIPEAVGDFTPKNITITETNARHILLRNRAGLTDADAERRTGKNTAYRLAPSVANEATMNRGRDVDA